jgi:hypothetical protein
VGKGPRKWDILVASPISLPFLSISLPLPNEAQGRRYSGAPWVAFALADFERRRRYRGSRVIRRQPFQGCNWGTLGRNPGCAARAATLGCGRSRLRRGGKSARRRLAGGGARSKSPKAAMSRRTFCHFFGNFKFFQGKGLRRILPIL